MPPKESAKEKKEREKAELLAQNQLHDRQQFELAEEKARQSAEVGEYVERLEASNAFYVYLVNPTSRLMVRQTEYQCVRDIMVRDGAERARQMSELTSQYLHMKDTYGQLQMDLVHLRTECRQLNGRVRKEQTAVLDDVRSELKACIERIEGDVLSHRSDVAQCGVHLHRALEAARIRCAQLAEATLHTAESITSVLQQHHSMHTRIPIRIRRELRRLDPDDLIRILDTLSFDDTALYCLRCRFPPPADDPFDKGDDGAILGDAS